MGPPRRSPAFIFFFSFFLSASQTKKTVRKCCLATEERGAVLRRQFVPLHMGSPSMSAVVLQAAF